jgi:hypothetical protein
MTLDTATFQDLQAPKIDAIAALVAWPQQVRLERVWLNFFDAVHVRKSVTRTLRYLIRKTSTPMRSHAMVACGASFSK